MREQLSTRNEMDLSHFNTVSLNVCCVLKTVVMLERGLC